MRRVRRLNTATTDQGELFAAYRYHAVFTDSPMPMIEAEAAHRAHAIIEQVHADLKNSALAHMPSGPTAGTVSYRVGQTRKQHKAGTDSPTIAAGYGRARNKGALKIRTFGYKVKLTITWRAPATSTYAAYTKTKRYKT